MSAAQTAVCAAVCTWYVRSFSPARHSQPLAHVFHTEHTHASTPMKTATKLLAFAAATLFANAQEGSDCSAEVAACAAVVACATAPDEVALMGSPEGQALMVCRGAFDGAGLDECMADLFACAEAEACAAALRAEDDVAIMATPEGQALLVCADGEEPCQAEVFACVETEACAAAYRAEDEIALMATREGQAWVVCFDDDPCQAERFACAEAEACAAAWRAEDRHTPRDSGDATCTPEGRAWFVCRENADNHDVTCLGEYANCMLCDQACTDVVGRFPRSGGWQLPTQADIDASNVCVTPSAHRWPTVG